MYTNLLLILRQVGKLSDNNKSFVSLLSEACNKIICCYMHFQMSSIQSKRILFSGLYVNPPNLLWKIVHFLFQSIKTKYKIKNISSAQNNNLSRYSVGQIVS